jgi:hypothetical protein
MIVRLDPPTPPRRLSSSNRDAINEERDLVRDQWLTSAAAPMVQDPLAEVLRSDDHAVAAIAQCRSVVSTPKMILGVYKGRIAPDAGDLPVQRWLSATSRASGRREPLPYEISHEIGAEGALAFTRPVRGQKSAAVMPAG